VARLRAMQEKILDNRSAEVGSGWLAGCCDAAVAEGAGCKDLRQAGGGRWLFGQAGDKRAWQLPAPPA
jgi:hypothetical protein